MSDQATQTDGVMELPDGSTRDGWIHFHLYVRKVNQDVGHVWARSKREAMFAVNRDLAISFAPTSTERRLGVYAVPAPTDWWPKSLQTDGEPVVIF